MSIANQCLAQNNVPQQSVRSFRNTCEAMVTAQDVSTEQDALQQLFNKCGQILDEVESLSLMSADISDYLTTSSHPLSEEERLALQYEKLRLIHVISETASALQAKVSGFFSSLEDTE